MNRPIQTMLMRKLSGELPLTPRHQQRPQESAMQSLHRQHLASLGNRGKTSDLFCIFHQVQESGLAAAIAWPEDPPKSNAKAAELLAQGDEFKNFHQVKFPNFDANQRRQFAFAACLYQQAYLKHPLVQSLFVTEPNRKFMLRYFYDYIQALAYLNVTHWNKAVSSFFPIASICNHSCEPDAILTGGTRTTKLIALRILDPNDQIFITYGPNWFRDFPNKPHGTRTQLSFDCICKVCNPIERNFWVQMGCPFGPKALKHFQIVLSIIADPRAPHAAKLNMMQQFVEKFDVDYPNDELCSILASYLDGLRKASVERGLVLARSEARERADKML
ncbi:hypothetical protein pipiens_012195 [Culex pipiens pipiens]|uniref:SET domain-containing protein n=1 Tax=Culex pipiens pipiens TaxID=38569 RepID=A0ABD1D3B5_CULPP